MKVKNDRKPLSINALQHLPPGSRFVVFIGEEHEVQTVQRVERISIFTTGGGEWNCFACEDMNANVLPGDMGDAYFFEPNEEDLKVSQSIAEVEEIHACLVDNEEGAEMLLSAVTKRGMMPLVTFNMSGVEMLRETAQQMANMSGQRIKLVKFTTRHEVEVIEQQEVQGADNSDLPH